MICRLYLYNFWVSENIKGLLFLFSTSIKFKEVAFECSNCFFLFLLVSSFFFFLSYLQVPFIQLHLFFLNKKQVCLPLVEHSNTFSTKHFLFQCVKLSSSCARIKCVPVHMRYVTIKMTVETILMKEIVSVSHTCENFSRLK